MTKSTFLPRSNALVFAFGLAMVLGSFGVQALQAQTYTVLHSFTSHPDGETPLAGVTLDAAGNIYGTASQGGNHNGGGHQGDGTIWNVDANGAFSVLYTFTGGIGKDPETALLLDGKGNLYGTARFGGHFNAGSVYSVAPDGQAKELYGFNSEARPLGRLALDRHRGILYGTTQNGGTGCNFNGCGTVWQLAPAHRLRFLYRFKGAPDGADPASGLVRDPAGNLYGVTLGGGHVNQQCQEGCGTVFKITRAGRKSTLYEFQGGNDGIAPAEGDLVLDAKGNVYGTTMFGGGGGGNSCSPSGCGIVFKINADGQETVLYTFQGGSGGADGAPNDGVLLDGNGGLYGTTPGEIFHVDANRKETVLYTFSCGTDGCNTNGDLGIDGSGALYGTTRSGGDLSCNPPNGCGVVFKLVP
jgi:uncharacterized repeat protein (TIGR03803 family)